MRRKYIGENYSTINELITAAVKEFKQRTKLYTPNPFLHVCVVARREQDLWTLLGVLWGPFDEDSLRDVVRNYHGNAGFILMGEVA